MILWSVEKMYLRRNDRSSTCPWSRVYGAVPVAVVAMGNPSALGDRVTLLSHPAVVVLLRVDSHNGAHAVVSEPAQLRASELVFTDLRRLEPHPNMHPGNGILLDAKRRRSEERRVGKECRSRWSPYH